MSIKSDEELKKAMGIRFKAFRETIGKSQEQFGEELCVNQGHLRNYEVGRYFPRIQHLQYLVEQYRLNSNWLVSGIGEMFLTEKTQSLYIPLPTLSTESDYPRFEKYLELNRMMKIPVIEQIMLGKLAEVKCIAKKEIEDFFKGEKLEKKKPELPENTNKNQA